MSQLLYLTQRFQIYSQRGSLLVVFSSPAPLPFISQSLDNPRLVSVGCDGSFQQCHLFRLSAASSQRISNTMEFSLRSIVFAGSGVEARKEPEPSKPEKQASEPSAESPPVKVDAVFMHMNSVKKRKCRLSLARPKQATSRAARQTGVLSALKFH